MADPKPDLAELARLYRAHVEWLEAHQYSSEYSEPRFDLACAAERHMPALLREARAAERMREALAELVHAAADLPVVTVTFKQAEQWRRFVKALGAASRKALAEPPEVYPRG